MGILDSAYPASLPSISAPQLPPDLQAMLAQNGPQQLPQMGQQPPALPVQPQAAQPQQSYPGLKRPPPAIGATVNGYTYLGGDPRSQDPSVWQPASGDTFLGSLPLDDNKKTIVKAIANYELPPGSQRGGLGSPEVQQLLGLAKQYDPSFDAKNYAGVLKARTEIGNPDSKFNLTKTALNTAIDHAKLLADNIDALHNTQSPTWNAVGNTFDRYVLGDPRQGNFQQTSRMLGQEVVKANTGGAGGGEGERITQGESYPVNGSPQQQYGSIQQTVKLLNGKLQEMQGTIAQAKLKDPNTANLLSPSAQASWADLNKRFAGQSGSPAPAAASQQPVADPQSIVNELRRRGVKVQ